MNVRQAYIAAREKLGELQIEDAGLEAEILLRHALGITRDRFFSDLDNNLSPECVDLLEGLVERRLTGEPSFYITGHREFFGLDFTVDSNVLIPRPETELLVEKALEFAARQDIKTIADIGTGSGAVAVSLAVNLPRATVYAVDISPAALETARENCRKHGVADRVVLLCGDLLEPLPVSADMIAANLPYVRNDEMGLQKELTFEPSLALCGGEDGMDVIRDFIGGAGNKLNPRGCFILEIGHRQAGEIISIIKGSFPRGDIRVFRDLSGIERVISVCLT